MKKLFLAIALFYSFMTVNAQEGGHVSPAATEWYTPVPAKVQPGDKPGNPPPMPSSYLMAKIYPSGCLP
ncbi:hypothetical protein NXU84_09365 [Parabacteroides distasonis]|nr:hypothetical protein [Parabacteroides distasonis]